MIHPYFSIRYILRLNGIYERNLNNDKITSYLGAAHIEGRADAQKEDSPIVLSIHPHASSNDKIAQAHPPANDQVVKIQARKLCIAVGSHPTVPGIPGSDLGITSDDFFNLEKCPRRCLVIGAGYIAVELATSMAHLGSQEIHLATRGPKVLTHFDSMVQEQALNTLKQLGIDVKLESSPVKMEKVSEANKDGGHNIKVTFANGQTIEVETVVWATGRHGRTDSLPGLDKLKNLEIDDKTKQIKVNEWMETSAKNVYALGDVAVGTPMLTPGIIKFFDL